MLRPASGRSVTPHNNERDGGILAEARDELGEEAFAAAWAQGRVMSLEQAIDDALEGSDASPGEEE